MTEAPKIDLAIASSDGETIRLHITVGGKLIEYQMTRSAAASMIERLARALA